MFPRPGAQLGPKVTIISLLQPIICGQMFKHPAPEPIGLYTATHPRSVWSGMIGLVMVSWEAFLAIESKDSMLASKLLVDFLRDFNLLTEHQLVAVRVLMENTVAEVMKSVTSINDVASQKKVKANEVLIKDKTSQDFVSSSSQELEKNEKAILAGTSNDSVRKDYLENKLMRTGGLFSKHMEAISGLDKDLQNIIAKIVGAVSVDDVIGQRLSHIISSMNELQTELSTLLANYRQNARADAIKLFRNRVLTQVYLSYTSEDERETFHKIFGHPKEMKRVG